VQTRGRGHQLELVGEVTVDRLNDRFVAAGVHPGRFADVPGQLALVHEPGERGLGRDLPVPVGELLRGAERGPQRGRRHHETDPQTGQQRLGERTEVEHPPFGVEALQRVERAGGEAELAVVVVLDDRRPSP